MVKPKKHLGQHFLTNQLLAKKIVDSLSTTDRIVEVGPGTGVLTKFLMDLGVADLLLVEKDIESVKFLEAEFPGINILERDILVGNWNFFEGRAYSMIGNLPYNVSSPIFFKLLENREFIRESIFMTQFEVGERIMSAHGSKSYGILSVLLQLFFDFERISKVGPGNFFPAPKVNSLVFRLRRNDRHVTDDFFAILKSIVKSSFSQRRKKLKNSLSSGFSLLDFVPPEFLGKRAEELRPDDFICMAENFRKKN
jgi:16S rRNA (adenine1518-N6/adenine1519-N6)-dimethyltransferase